MELTIAWFWALKLTILSATIYVIYLAFLKKRFKNVFLNIMAGALILFSVFTPIKLDVDTRSHTSYANNAIQQTKTMPSKVVDNSFEESQKDLGIKEFEVK